MSIQNSEQPATGHTIIEKSIAVPPALPLLRRPSSATLAAIAGGLVAVASIVGILLHGCGHVAYTTYLKSWGIQEGLFPQNSDWKVVRGYYAVVLQSSSMFREFPWSTVLLSTLTLTLGIFILRLPVKGIVEIRVWIEARQAWIA